MEKVDYPVKYAVLGIYEQVGGDYFCWAGPIYDVCGYIVSKVYLVDETTRYTKSGTIEQHYQVVYPLSQPALQGLSTRQVPHRDIYGRYTNLDNVSEVFEDFEKAKKRAEEQNQEIKSRIITANISCSDPNWQQKYQELEEEFKQRIQRYSEYEQAILNKTEDMVVLKTSSIEEVISKIINNPNMFYQAIGEALSPEERMYIMSKIERKCSTCTNISCRVENNEKPIEDCIGWINQEIIGRSKLLGK